MAHADAGSGLSDGETISLGFYEQDDLMAVIEYLRARSSSLSLASPSSVCPYVRTHVHAH